MRFGDIDFRIEYRTVPGRQRIYLRAFPGAIWDWNQVFDPKNPRGDRTWVGGCSTNTPGSAGRDPLDWRQAIRPWIPFRIVS